MAQYLIQQILNGIQLGSIYALIALGYTMVYGIIKLINFAHADIFMAGAYAAFFITASYSASHTTPFLLWIWISLIAAYLLSSLLIDSIPFLNRLYKEMDSRRKKSVTWFSEMTDSLIIFMLNLFIIVVLTALIAPSLYFPISFMVKSSSGLVLFFEVILFSMAVCAMLGAALEKMVYRPLRNRARLSVLISALGASLFIENFSSLDIVFGNSYRAFPAILPRITIINFESLGISITSIFALNIIVLTITLIGLWLLVEKTLIGKQMRAVSFDKSAAALMGINIDRVISFTFMTGAALAGVSGVLYGINYGVLQSPFLGFTPGIKAFIAAVLGGIGSLPGAVLGAFLMGISEVFANSVDSNLGFAAAFVVLILVLLIKPTGLLGKADNEKV